MKKEFASSISISLTFLLLGFILLHCNLIGYGLSFFVFLPFILGYILGKGIVKEFGLYGFLFSLATFFILLYIGNLEGMVCILMALPLILIVFFIGYLLNRINELFRKKNDNDNIIKSSFLSLISFITIGFVEKELVKNDNQVIPLTTVMIFPYTTEQVYESIKSVDTLTAELPFLMKIDLPVPTKCILEKEEVGGLRICYFSGGTITEKITELEKAKVLRMDVIEYKLTGRKWLGFKEAIYFFDKIGQDSCKLKRITTYTSTLKPRFYWQPLEKLGISQEHEYVLNNLKNDLKKKYGR